MQVLVVLNVWFYIILIHYRFSDLPYLLDVAWKSNHLCNWYLLLYKWYLLLYKWYLLFYKWYLLLYKWYLLLYKWYWILYKWHLLLHKWYLRVTVLLLSQLVLLFGCGWYTFFKCFRLSSTIIFLDVQCQSLRHLEKRRKKQLKSKLNTTFEIIYIYRYIYLSATFLGVWFN